MAKTAQDTPRTNDAAGQPAQVVVTYKGDKRWDNSAGLTLGKRNFVTDVPQVLPKDEADALQQELDANKAYQHYKFKFEAVPASAGA